MDEGRIGGVILWSGVEWGLLGGFLSMWDIRVSSVVVLPLGLLWVSLVGISFLFALFLRCFYTHGRLAL